MTEAVVGIAIVQVALGGAMVGEHQLVGHTMFINMRLNTLAQSIDISRRLVIAANKMQFWNPAGFSKGLRHGIKG